MAKVQRLVVMETVIKTELRRDLEAVFAEEVKKTPCLPLHALFGILQRESRVSARLKVLPSLDSKLDWGGGGDSNLKVATDRGASGRLLYFISRNLFGRFCA